MPPQDDESRWNPPADDQDNGQFFSGFRAYRGDAVAAVASATAAASTTTTDEPHLLDGGEDVDAAGATAAGTTGRRGAEGLAFHHFPIPDLSPAENTEILSGLVDQLEALVASGKVVP